MPTLPKNPQITAPQTLADTRGLSAYLLALYRDLTRLLGEFSTTINGKVELNGNAPMLAPFPLQQVAVADLPAAASFTGTLLYVTDETGGPTVAYSNGTNWLRVYDNATVS